jgi:hypothetical protein
MESQQNGTPPKQKTYVARADNKEEWFVFNGPAVRE